VVMLRKHVQYVLYIFGRKSVFGMCVCVRVSPLCGATTRNTLLYNSKQNTAPAPRACSLIASVVVTTTHPSLRIPSIFRVTRTPRTCTLHRKKVMRSRGGGLGYMRTRSSRGTYNVSCLTAPTRPPTIPSTHDIWMLFTHVLSSLYLGLIASHSRAIELAVERVVRFRAAVRFADQTGKKIKLLTTTEPRSALG